ncbi:MAG: efflux RND transporter periplasmic adaptor subunit [Planctomycetes bacterium]|nr:efflux RND transporter periplasmic adaptor subunit [Planctomycetota bacterium]
MNNKLHLQSWRVVGVLFTAFCGAWIAGCQPAPKQADSGKSSSAEAARPPVAVGTVRAQQLEKSVKMPATVESDEQAMLMAKVEAYVKEVLVDIGDEVAAGQVLMRLDAPELQHKAEQQQRMIGQLRADGQVLQAELAAARTQLDALRAKLALENSERDRLERLVSSGAINRQRLEEAEFESKSAAASLARYENVVRVAEAKLEKGEAEIQVAQSRLKEALAMVDYLEIKAPFSGVVATRNVDPGALVRPGTSGKSLLTVAKVDRLRAIFFVTMDTTSQLAVGNVVKFEADDVPGRLFEGVISRIAGTYDVKTRMLRAEVDLQNSPDPSTGRRPLRAGSYGEATIILQLPTLPVVPQSAVFRHAGRTSVVIVRDGICLISPVQVAIETEGLAGISSGLQAGDQVVIDNPGALSDGQDISSEIKMEAW